MTDIVELLRQDALSRQNGLGFSNGPAIEDKAADEITRLRQTIENLKIRARQQTSLE